jgi:hypothetical protein
VYFLTPVKPNVPSLKFPLRQKVATIDPLKFQLMAVKEVQCVGTKRRMIWKLFLLILLIGLLIGFASGYGTRAAISHHRRAKAARNRMLFQ